MKQDFIEKLPPDAQERIPKTSNEAKREDQTIQGPRLVLRFCQTRMARIYRGQASQKNC